MIKVALSGNIASGKSEAEKIFKKLNIPIIDTDHISHKILKNNRLAIEQTKNLFKDFNIIENGLISREKLAKIIFEDKNSREKLEQIMHPIIIEEIICFFNSQNNQKIAVVSIPLLFEAKMEPLFDKIIFLSADINIRLKRLIERRGYTKEHALNRIQAQENEEEKIKKADYIIYNDSSISYLEKEIKKIIKEIN